MALSRMQNFIAALDLTNMLLFRQMDSGSFEKLQVNWAQLSDIMQSHGGEKVFGAWPLWGIIPSIYALFSNSGKIKHSVNCSPVFLD